MIRGFLDRLMGTLGWQEIDAEAHAFISSCGEVTLEAPRFKNALAPSQWWDEVVPTFRSISEGRSKQQQALALRGIITEAVEKKFIAMSLLSDKLTPGDVAIASKAIEGLRAKTLDEIYLHCSRQYVLQELTIRFARHLAGKHFQDARDNDYLRQLEGAASLYYERHFETYVANEKDEDDFLARFLPSIKKIYDDTIRVVLSGGNYDTTNYDKDKEPEETSQTPRPDPPKLSEVHEDQIDALARVLGERYQRLRTGNLYVVDGYPPKKPLQALIVDGGMMLTALHERCAHDELAEKTLRRVLVSFARLPSVPKAQGEEFTPESINIEGQIALHDVWKGGDGGLGSALTFAAMLLFDVSAEQFETMSSSERRYFGELSAKLIKDAWEVYAKTSNLLGGDTNEVWPA